MPSEQYSFERYLNVRSAYGASFSPDGQQLSFLTDITGVAEVWSVSLQNRTSRPLWPEQLTFRGERVASATFSPRTELLLVAGDAGGNERTQLYLLSVDGERFTSLTDNPDTIFVFGGWAPDGNRIVYSSNERDARYFDVYEHNLRDSTTRLLLSQDGTNYVVGYAPDGQAVIVSRHDSNIRNQLLLVDTQTREVRELTPELAAGIAEHLMPAWTADRQGLYLLSNRGRNFLSLAYLDLANAEMRFLSDYTYDIEVMKVSRDGHKMALTRNEDGYSSLELYDVGQGWEQRQSLMVPTLPRGVINELVWSEDGLKLAITLSTCDDAVDIWIWDMDECVVRRATQSTLGGIPREAFVTPSMIRYPSFDGLEIPAFLYVPKGQQSNLPTVIYVHGGPESQIRPLFNPVIQYLVNRGYAVLAPNVRGSTGYGSDYQSLDDVRKRMDSVADLKHAVLWLCEQEIANAERIAVMGGSYGGFMVLSALTTYPELWAAGVDIVGIANFVTFLENTGPWRRKQRESEYGSLEQDREFLEQISPIRHIDRITAPLFVIHGANDPRVPLSEAEQIVNALRGRAVPVEYMVFADEGHGLIKRSNRLKAYPAIARFLDQYLDSATIDVR